MAENAFLFRNSEATRDFENSFRRAVREAARCKILRKELAERKERREIWKRLDYFYSPSIPSPSPHFSVSLFLNAIVEALPVLTAEVAPCGMTSSSSCPCSHPAERFTPLPHKRATQVTFLHGFQRHGPE